MSKRNVKFGSTREPERKPQKFVEPVVLTPVEVLPEVARDVAERTRTLVKKLTGASSNSKERSVPRTKATVEG